MIILFLNIPSLFHTLASQGPQRGAESGRKYTGPWICFTGLELLLPSDIYSEYPSGRRAECGRIDQSFSCSLYVSAVPPQYLLLSLLAKRNRPIVLLEHCTRTGCTLIACHIGASTLHSCRAPRYPSHRMNLGVASCARALLTAVCLLTLLSLFEEGTPHQS